MCFFEVIVEGRFILNLIVLFAQLMVLFFELKKLLFDLLILVGNFLRNRYLAMIDFKYLIEVFNLFFAEGMLLYVFYLRTQAILSFLNHHFQRTLQICEFDLQLFMLIADFRHLPI